MLLRETGAFFLHTANIGHCPPRFFGECTNNPTGIKTGKRGLKAIDIEKLICKIFYLYKMTHHTNDRKNQLWYWFLMVFLVYIQLYPTNDLQAQNPQGQADTFHTGQSIFDLEGPLQFSLAFDIREFTKTKFDDVKIPAVLSYHKTDGTTISQDIKIESRGQSRKKICYFPPIKLKLKKATFEDPYLDEVNSHKLVTHCNTSKRNEQNVLKEYLAYKLMNIFSGNSFRVQLIEMTYVDTRKKPKSFMRHAFLIEHIDRVCKRNNCVEVENEKLTMKAIDTTSMIRFSLFQFMIGNVDWTIPNLHNVKLMKSLDIRQIYLYAIPYDFDHSGLVNAGYAVNVRDPDIQSVKTRMFAGMCYTESDYRKEIENFIARRANVFSVIDTFEGLDKRARKEVRSYIEDFYSLIEQPDFYEKYVARRCVE